MASMNVTARKVPSQEKRNSAPDEADIYALMREFFHKKQSGDALESAAEVPIMLQPAAPRRDFDMATELLDRASKAFDLLITRCQALDHDLDDANEQAQLRAAEQEEAIEQWKRLASGLKEQLDASSEASMALKARCDSAEARAAAAEQRASALERASAQVAAHAATADRLSTRLHDKVVAAFGIGSRAHPVLEAIATRTAAE